MGFVFNLDNLHAAPTRQGREGLEVFSVEVGAGRGCNLEELAGGTNQAEEDGPARHAPCHHLLYF